MLSDLVTGNFNVSVQEALCRSFRSYADRPAVIDPKVSLSYADLGRRSARLANRILALTKGVPVKTRNLGYRRVEWIENIELNANFLGQNPTAYPLLIPASSL